MTEEAPNAGSWAGKAAAIFAAVAVGVYAFVSVTSGDSAAEDAGTPRGEAWDSCKRVVAAQLTNADSADFTLLSTDFAEQPDGGWSIAGSLTAENDFGVEREVGYSCHVTKDGHTTAEVS